AVDTDDHGRWDRRRLEHTDPAGDALAVAREHDGLGPTGREVRGHLPPTIGIDRLGEQLACDPWGVPVRARGHRGPRRSGASGASEMPAPGARPRSAIGTVP